MTSEIALFPLQTVLYPTIATRLQVFEQRYLRLVRECMAESKSFGVVPIIEGSEAGATPEIFNWGTLVNIKDFDQLPNGLFSITISGDQRIQVKDTRVEDDGLMLADVEIYDPDPEDPITFAEDDLVDMLESLAKHMGVGPEVLLKDITRAKVAWRLAGVLPVQGELKMSLLAMDDVDARLLEVKKWVVEMRMRGQR